jgi:glycine cleavage system T protein
MPDPVRSPLADYHLGQGIELTEYHGALVPLRFEGSQTEYAAVRSAAGLFDFSHRAKFAVRGADRVRFLQGMVTNDVKLLAPGQGTYAALLNAQGHLLADLRVYREEETYLIDTDADLRDKILATLNHYVIMDQVEFEPLGLFTLAFQGPRARALLEKTLHLDIPPMKEFEHFATNYGGFPARVVCASATGEEGYEVWAPVKGMLAVWGAACGQAPTYDMLPCGTEALEILRIEAGIPRYGSELDEDTLLLEAGLLNAVSFTKGCYVGQEIVERVRTQGHVNCKLVGLVSEAAQLPRVGEKLLAGGKEIGEVTSACFSPHLHKAIALAYVRREVADPGVKVALASGADALVTSLPFYRRTASLPRAFA